MPLGEFVTQLMLSQAIYYLKINFLFSSWVGG
jgi:hypothetical protein